MYADHLVTPVIGTLAPQAKPQVRSLTLLNELGDITVTWSPETDDQMKDVIQRLMDQGVTFFELKKGLIRTRRSKIKSLDELKGRTISLGDEHFEKMFFNGAVEMQRRGEGAIETTGTLKTAEAVARAPATVATRALSGG